MAVPVVTMAMLMLLVTSFSAASHTASDNGGGAEAVIMVVGFPCLIMGLLVGMSVSVVVFLLVINIRGGQA